MENIVTTEKLRKIPKAAFDFVEVENNLNISSINNFDFDGFLKTRLLTDGVDEQTVDGIYFFDNIQVEGIFRYNFKLTGTQFISPRYESPINQPYYNG